MSISEQDKIGREEFVDKICGLVDSLGKDKNFCLSLNGAWGSGKSFVLSMIEEKLLQKSEYIVIKYDAWENSFYYEPLIAILSCVIDCLEHKLSKMKGYGKVAAEVGKKKSKEIVEKLSEFGGKIGFIAKVIKDFTEIIPNLKNVSLATDTKDAQLEIFKSYKSLLGEVKELLNKLTKKVFTENEQTRLIILVDEIDRCLPDDQLKILERLHHLFGVNNCAVIVALNQVCVAKTVQTIYGIDGYEYLRKFFTFTFKLEISASEYLENLFHDYKIKLGTIKNLPKNIEFSISMAYHCLRYGDKKVLNNVDNREITRYFDCVNNVCNAFGWANLNVECLLFILIALYIRRTISSNFLDVFDICAKQEQRDAELTPLDDPEVQMPYFDYFKMFLGIDRKNVSKAILKFDHNGYFIAKYSYIFNEIVYFSIENNSPNILIRRNLIQPTVHPERCKKLRELIILYGGEQDKCER